MPQYEVTGSNVQGKTVKLIVDAESVRSARGKAKQQGLIPLTVNSAGSGGSASIKAAAIKEGDVAAKRSFLGGIKGREIAEMTRQLAVLLKAHVPIVESFNALVEQIEKKNMKRVLMAIRQYVKEGKGLAEGFALFPQHFNRIYINMVRAGESSGRLDVVLMRLADFYETQEKQKGKVIGALSYPIFIMLAGLGALTLIFIKVIPTIKTIFTDQGQALPWATQLLIDTSDFLDVYIWPMLIGTLLTLLLFERYIGTKKGRAQKDEFLLKAPIFKNLIKALSIARFGRTLSTLLASGVPMLEALEISKNVVDQHVYEVAIEQAKTQVQEGRSLAAALHQTTVFPPIVIHMIGVGEKTGELEPMLMNVAESYELQVDTAINAVTGLLSPLMVGVMVVFVGFIMMAILNPIMEMNSFAM